MIDLNSKIAKKIKDNICFHKDDGNCYKIKELLSAIKKDKERCEEEQQ